MTLNVESLTHPLKIKKRIQETTDSVSLILGIPTEHKKTFRYTAGQFVTLFLDIKGESVARSYSLSSAPEVDQEFMITIKRVSGGKASNYILDQLHEGDIVRVTPPAGHFFNVKKVDQQKHYVLFAAGSGVTPVFSILKTVLKHGASASLFYANRNEAAVIFRQNLTDLANQQAQMLYVQHFFSQDYGRCAKFHIEQFYAAVNKRFSALTKDVYMCGPDGFMSTIRSALSGLGVAAEQLHSESFAIGAGNHPPSTTTSATEPTSDAPNGVLVGDASATTGVPEKIIAIIGGQTHEVQPQPQQSVLETLLESGANPPYSCMNGACMACLAKVEEGQIFQEDAGILSEDNIRKKEALTCQAKAVTKIVKLNFDSL